VNEAGDASHKLDRLSATRISFSARKRARLTFVAADAPEANPFTVGIMVLVAQQEREATSRRTPEALAAARARGVELACLNGAKHLRQYRNGLAGKH
jgi:DNA invertase Pin-like site-specific DNA recombinase